MPRTIIERGLIEITKTPGPNDIQIQRGQFVLTWYATPNQPRSVDLLNKHRQRIPIDSTREQIQRVIALGNRIIAQYRSCRE